VDGSVPPIPHRPSTKGSSITEGGRPRPGCGFAGHLVQRIVEIGPGQAKERLEEWRQRAAGIEEIIERIGDVLVFGDIGAGRQ
jgi:hypothetical protein